jgi:hypothetical protein
MSWVSSVWRALQGTLFPHLEEALGPLAEQEQELVKVVELVEVAKFTKAYRWKRTGCRPKDRTGIMIAFLAKAIYNLPTTRALFDYLCGAPRLRRLCGWEQRTDVPSESTFSRAFAAFARDGLLDAMHGELVRKGCQSRLVFHVNRDATAIKGREKPAKKAKQPKSEKPRKLGRPRKDEPREPEPPKRLDVQPTRTLEENLAELPQQCDVGCKRNSKGYQTTWVGYKFHIDTIDGEIPVSAILTSASVHDSQVAIPLMQKTAGRLASLYDIMDAAYDAPQIHDFSAGLNHVPIIDNNPRRGGKRMEMEPARATRFRQRTTSERCNSTLLDNYGGRNVRVRGAAKVMTHLMFGLLPIAAMALFRVFG